MAHAIVRILLLEDDLETLTKLITEIGLLEKKLDKVIAVTIFSEYWQVTGYLNTNPREVFNVVLVDRDCKSGGSFHVLDMEKFASATIIGISSVPEYNRQLKDLGVTVTVDKNYRKLEAFAQAVGNLMEKLLSKSNDSEIDNILQETIEWVEKSGTVSFQQIMTMFNVSYSRAIATLNQLEKRGIIEPSTDGYVLRKKNQELSQTKCIIK